MSIGRTPPRRPSPLKLSRLFRLLNYTASALGTQIWTGPYSSKNSPPRVYPTAGACLCHTQLCIKHPTLRCAVHPKLCRRWDRRSQASDGPPLSYGPDWDTAKVTCSMQVGKFERGREKDFPCGIIHLVDTSRTMCRQHPIASCLGSNSTYQQ